MKTKVVIENQFKNLAVSDTVYFDIPDYVHFIHKFPYKRFHSKNGLYHFCCMFLEEGTNMLVVKTANGSQPATMKLLSKLSGMALTTFQTYFSLLMSDGIIMRVETGKLKWFYMNPAFAVAGKHLSESFIDMWRVSGDRIIGEHMFADDNELTNDNKNRDARFGYLRDREPYTPYNKSKVKRRKK